MSIGMTLSIFFTSGGRIEIIQLGDLVRGQVLQIQLCIRGH